MREQRAVERLELVVGHGALQDQRPFEHLPWAPADQAYHLSLGHRRSPGQRERVIHRGAKVGERIEQRAVEVETDDVEGDVAHGAGPCSAAVETASDWWQRHPP